MCYSRLLYNGDEDKSLDVDYFEQTWELSCLPGYFEPIHVKVCSWQSSYSSIIVFQFDKTVLLNNQYCWKSK